MVGARGFEPRTGGLKVRCDTISPYSVLVPPVRVELTLVGLRVRYATITSRRDGCTIFSL